MAPLNLTYRIELVDLVKRKQHRKSPLLLLLLFFSSSNQPSYRSDLFDDAISFCIVQQCAILHCLHFIQG